jgi:hypothetical protein
MRRLSATGALLSTLALGLVLVPHTQSAAEAGPCRVTIPTRTVPPDGGMTAASFNYGGRHLRAHLGWPKGVLRAGRLPDGGFMATIESDGSIHTKMGWWRGVRGKLVISGRRLDAAAPPLRSSVPMGYGKQGFQPSGLSFPSVGCWRVVGRVGHARLTFVVKVTKIA